VADENLIDDSTARTKRSLECEFCGCTLSATGEVLRRSKRAREMMDLSEESSRAFKHADDLKQEIAALRKALAEAEAKATARSSRAFVFDDDDDE
jgi:uncharacterized protein YlxW (UPF0749 family)